MHNRAEHPQQKRREAGRPAPVALSRCPPPPPLFHQPLSPLLCQQLTLLAPSVFRADSWLGEVPLFLYPHWHLSQFFF
uniref:Uncharacterized protein n=1 Tax=Neovison vison TaxID=452646 RepID=A0A8C7BB94_NEOVI